MYHSTRRLLRVCTRPSKVSTVREMMSSLRSRARSQSRSSYSSASRIEALEFGMLPEKLRLLASFNTADHLLLHQEHVADVSQQLLAVSPSASLLSQCRSKRLDAVEVLGDPRLVMREHEALSEDVGNQLQSLYSLFAQKDVFRRDRHAGRRPTRPTGAHRPAPEPGEPQ